MLTCLFNDLLLIFCTYLFVHSLGNSSLFVLVVFNMLLPHTIDQTSSITPLSLAPLPYITAVIFQLDILPTSIKCDTAVDSYEFVQLWELCAEQCTPGATCQMSSVWTESS